MLDNRCDDHRQRQEEGVNKGFKSGVRIGCITAKESVDRFTIDRPGKLCPKLIKR